MRMRPAQADSYPHFPSWDSTLLPFSLILSDKQHSFITKFRSCTVRTPELSLPNYQHLPFLMCLTLQTLAVTCWLHLVAGEIQTGFLTFFKNPERDLIQPLLSQKHSSELRLTRTCAGFNGIMFTQVLHLPDSCWFGYDNSWPSWERTESFYSNLNDLSQKTASSNMQPNSCLRGRIFKPSLCCFSFQIDIVFLEVMSRDMVFIKCSNGNAASQITCHCNCPVLRALFNGRINTGKRGRRAELTHYLVSSPCDPPETLPGIKFPFRPKLTHLFLSQSSKKMNRKKQNQVLFGVRLRYHWPTLKKWCQKKAVFHKRKIVWKGVGESLEIKICADCPFSHSSSFTLLLGLGLRILRPYLYLSVHWVSSSLEKPFEVPENRQQVEPEQGRVECWNSRDRLCSGRSLDNGSGLHQNTSYKQGKRKWLWSQNRSVFTPASHDVTLSPALRLPDDLREQMGLKHSFQKK